MSQLHEAITVNVGEVGLPPEKYDLEAELFARAISGIVTDRLEQPGKYLIQKYEVSEMAWTSEEEEGDMKLIVMGEWDKSIEDWVVIWQKPSGELVKIPVS